MRTLVIGDVHGCLEELDELLALGRSGCGQVASVGDLVDRGPDSVGCVRRMRELDAAAVMGNHEEKHLRYREHEKRRLTDGRKNPMRAFSEHKLVIQASLSEADWSYLAKLPLWVKLAADLYVVHAGCAPGTPVERQERNNLLRMRYLKRATGAMVKLGDEELLTPAVAAYWTEVWNGPERVIYGHHPTADHTAMLGPLCYGIDTGCVYGGWLTGLVVEDGAVLDTVQVRARRVYHERSNRD